MLFKEIQKAGFDGSYPLVTKFIYGWREAAAKVTGKSAFVPLKFQLGEAFQFDWSEELLVIGGIQRKLLVAHTKLCASRAFWLVAYLTQGHEMLFDAHTRAFTAMGGIARRGIYDNIQVALTVNIQLAPTSSGHIPHGRLHYNKLFKRLTETIMERQ
jgi:transposase